MKKSLPILAMMILLVSMVVPVMAQTGTTAAPGTWTSSINIQNVGSGSADSVVIEFFNASGGSVLSFPVASIPMGGSRTLVIEFDVPGLTQGQFSAVVSSDQPLETIVNSTSKLPITAGAYQGVKSEETATTLYFPGLYKSYYGFSSELVLQNTDTNQATVTIQFYKQSDGSEIVGAKLTGQTIAGNSTKIFTMASNAGIPSGSAGLVSAKVSSDKPLAGVGNIWSSAKFGLFGDYNGYLSGNNTVYAPALYKNYYGFVSSLTVMNLSPSVTTKIQVTYSNGATEPITTLLPGQAKEFYQPGNASLPSGSAGVFSAKVVSGVDGSTAAPLVALVNVEDKTKGLFASYNAPSATATKLGCPVVMQSYYGWFTAETVQNVGTLPTSIKVTYATGETVTFTNIPANGTKNVVELLPGSVLPSGRSVSATIESISYGGNPAQPLVAVTQENSTRYSTYPGDYLLAYTCIPQP